MLREPASLYFKNNINDLVWPEHDDANYLKDYFLPLIRNGTKDFIKNIDTDVFIIKVGNKVLPGVISKNLTDCYVASPYAHYITYAQDELNSVAPFVGQKLLKVILKGLGWFLAKSDFNRAVYVNNWLLSTNLYIDLSLEEILSINKKLIEALPKHTIIYRSLNKKSNKQLMSIFNQLNMKKIVSRQVYISDPKDLSYKKRRDYVSDQKLLSKTKYRIKSEDFDKSEIAAIEDLYNQLYLNKYSKLNPQFTAMYFKNAIDKHLYNFKTITSDEQVKGVLGYFARNSVMTTPIFGYDINAPINEGYYRLLSALLLNDSEQKSLLLNQSSGASEFKRQRGAQAVIEYNYYLTQHCSIRQKFAWGVVAILLNSLGAYILKKYKL